MIENLESRQLLSVAPALQSIDVMGPVHRADSIILTFNESLNPTTAQNTKAYVFGRPVRPSSNDGSSLGDILGFLVKRPKAIKSGKIQFASAVYDDADHTVTLTPYKPFNASGYFRGLRVYGTGANAVADVAGDALNGGVDSVLRWNYRTGKSIHYTDADGDKVTLSMKGPGAIFAFLRRAGDPNPTIFINGATAKSILKGSVVEGRTGDNVADIAELWGAPSSTTLIGNANFNIQSTS